MTVRQYFDQTGGIVNKNMNQVVYEGYPELLRQTHNQFMKMLSCILYLEN